MKDERLEQILLEAQQRAAAPRFHGQPWPMVLFPIVASWLVTLPALALICLVLIGLGARDAWPFSLAGLSMMVCSEMVTRAQESRFTEQIGVCLLLGGGCLAGGIAYLDQPEMAGIAIVALTLIPALFSGPDWLRAPLGAVAAIGMLHVLQSVAHAYWLPLAVPSIEGLAVNVAVWLLVLLIHHVPRDSSVLSTAGLRLQAVADGWLLGTCAGLVVWSGSTFLLDAQFSWTTYDTGATSTLAGVASILMVVAAGGWFMWRWHALRNWRCASAVLALAELAWFSHGLGPAVLCVAGCTLHGKRRLAVVASICAAWVVGAGYYQLAWPLMTKALVFASVGCILLVSAYAPTSHGKPLALLSRLYHVKPPEVSVQDVRPYAATCLVVTLLLANILIAQREYQIAHGAQVFVRMAPLDPRSLMQGDHIAVDMEFSRSLNEISRVTGKTQAILVTGDDRVVLQVKPDQENVQLASNEHRVRFEVDGWRATLGSNAWYFTEGDAKRRTAARYGEYRIDRSGKVFLVGLRGVGLAPL